MSDTLSNDLLEGVMAIAAFFGKTERQTHHLLEKKRLPAFKLAGKWHMRRSTGLAFIERLEAGVP